MECDSLTHMRWIRVYTGEIPWMAIQIQNVKYHQEMYIMPDPYTRMLRFD